MTENPDTQSIDWTKRHTDPVVRWKWEAATRVTRADPAKGIHTGMITYPDGTHQFFRR